MLRMPRHTQTSKYQETPPFLRAFHPVTHAQTYTTSKYRGIPPFPRAFHPVAHASAYIT